MSLGRYHIKNGTIIDLEGKLLGGAGRGTDKEKAGKGAKSPKPVDGTMQSAFRTLQLHHRKEETEQAAETDREAGAVMGEGEELRKQEAKAEAEQRKKTEKGLRREKETRFNEATSTNLEEIV